MNMCENCAMKLRELEWDSTIGNLPNWTDEELNEIINECQKIKRERRIEKFRKVEDRTPGWRNG